MAEQPGDGDRFRRNHVGLGDLQRLEDARDLLRLDQRVRPVQEQDVQVVGVEALRSTELVMCS